MCLAKTASSIMLCFITLGCRKLDDRPSTVATPSAARTARDIASSAFKSVVLLVMEDSNGNPISLGSGFYVKEKLVVTNTHVVEGARGGTAKLVSQTRVRKVDGVVAYDPARDLALLSLSEGLATPLNLGDNETLAVGDVVFAVGNPRGLEGTFSEGIISSIRKFNSDNILQITAPISPGSSGGPVLDVEGNVIGVATATLRSGQNLNFAIPISYVKALIERGSFSAPFWPKSIIGSNRGAIADLARPSMKGVLADHFLWDNSALGQYSFSIRNNLEESVHEVDCIAIFYDSSGTPVETKSIRFNDVIPAGLARRVTSAGNYFDLMVGESVYRLTRRIEIRVLDFKISNK